MIIINGFQPLTIITKSSTLDVAAVLNPLLILPHQYKKVNKIISLIKTLVSKKKLPGHI